MLSLIVEFLYNPILIALQCEGNRYFNYLVVLQAILYPKRFLIIM